jgi:lipid-A-disaccharide synthase
MPMRIFLSAGEPSGDLHGSNLVLALRRLDPATECIGFGGERMQATGCRLLFPLCQLAVMGLSRVLVQAPLFLRLLLRADRYFRRERPDAVVLIDYPGFHWWLARRAHAHGIPVFYFVPPQIWAWASGRVRKMRRSVDHVLCSLPFEEAWYRERGVDAQYIGHPYFDELPHQNLDQDFLTRQQAGPGTIIGLLPGSRTQEVEFNLSTLMRAAARVHEARPDTRFLVACYKQAHEEHVRQYLHGHAQPFVEPCSGRTAEILQLAHCCIAVSGSVGLELLFRGKPSVVVYRLRRLLLFLVRLFKKSRYISLVNLLAGKALFPEFLTARDESEAIAGHVLRWLNDPKDYASLQTELAAVRERVAEPGACERAARYIIRILGQQLEMRREEAA